MANLHCENDILVVMPTERCNRERPPDSQQTEPEKSGGRSGRDKSSLDVERCFPRSSLALCRNQLQLCGFPCNNGRFTHPPTLFGGEVTCGFLRFVVRLRQSLFFSLRS